MTVSKPISGAVLPAKWGPVAVIPLFFLFLSATADEIASASCCRVASHRYET